MLFTSIPDQEASDERKLIVLLYGLNCEQKMSQRIIPLALKPRNFNVSLIV